MNILVTGGASGLGEAITKKLAEAESNFVNFTYFNSFENAKKIEQSLKNTRSYKCNFTDSESVNKFIEQIEDMNPDVLVNNAITGITKKHFHKMSPGDFEGSFTQNIIPVIKITQSAIVCFKKKRFGKILTILSTAIVNLPPIGWSEYAANKSYLLSLSKSWAAEYAKFNITSNCISPSFMLTGLNKDTDERVIEEIKAQNPNGYLLDPGEAASAVLKMITASQDVNGINMIINSTKDVI